MSMDGTSLSSGELYTVLTGKDRHGRKGCLAAIVAGTKSENHHIKELLNRLVRT